MTLPAKKLQTHRARRRISVTVLLAAVSGFLAVALPAWALTGPPEVQTLHATAGTQTTLGPFEGSFVTPGKFGENVGLETHWQFDYAESEGGPWTQVPGGSGTVIGDEASEQGFIVKATGEVTGLTPEKTYYLRLTATNKHGTGSAIAPVSTAPLHPVISGSPQVGEIRATSAVLSGTVNPENSETKWRFEYATSENGPWTIGATGTIAASEAAERLVGQLSGLVEETTYYVRLFAENGHEPAATSAVEKFATAGPPTATTFAVHAIHGEALRLLGAVHPHGYDTHYRFEYVTQEHFKREGFTGASSTSTLDAGGGGGEELFGVYDDVVVGADAPGLTPGVKYTFRIVAESAAPGNPVVMGGDQQLTVPGASSPGGEPACPNEQFRSGPSAALPDCRAYEQVTPAEKGGAMDVFKYGFKFEGARVGEDGEHVLLHALGVQWGESPDPGDSDYFFARTEGGWKMTSVRPAGEASATSYLPELYSADLTEIGLGAGWATTLEYFSPRLEFELGPPGGPYRTVASVPRSQRTKWVAGPPDGNSAILASEDHALLGHATGTTSGQDLYEFSGGQSRQVNVLGVSPGTPIGSCGAAIVESPLQGYLHPVSDDGSRVFFTDNCTHHLYVRIGGAETVDVGAREFLAANASGTRLLLQEHTGNAYELLSYDVESGTATPLLSLTKGLTQGVASADFSTLYFYSPDRLTPEAPLVVTTLQDLYRLDVESGKVSFLLRGGSPEMFASPEGRYLYFGGGAGGNGVDGLTPGLRLHDEIGGLVYRYDSAENVVECMSCASSFDPQPRFGAQFVAEIGMVVNTPDKLPYPSVASSNGDYVFFETPSALLPQDIDGEIEPETGGEYPGDGFISPSTDVYEWRGNGVDGCTHIQGCLGLISSGRGGYKVIFLGTSPSGRDALFATHEALVAQDKDRAGDIYDARIGGGFPGPPPPPVECEGDACSTPLSAPIDTTPSSLTFTGLGNVPPETANGAKAKPKTKRKRHRPTGKRCAHVRNAHVKCVKAKAKTRRAARRISGEGR